MSPVLDPFSTRMGPPLDPSKCAVVSLLPRSENSLQDFRPEATVERTVQPTPHSQALVYHCKHIGKVCHFLRDARI